MTTTLITGANRSLGLETTRRLLDAGHTVYAGMRDPATGDAARQLGAHVVQLDVTESASVEAAIAQLPELDVLINNAGILGTAFSVEDLDVEAMTTVLDTNVVGIVRVTHHRGVGDEPSPADAGHPGWAPFLGYADVDQRHRG